jgi:CHAT domain-containing protein/tetratricopeptide (TPR) repeat protein
MKRVLAAAVLTGIVACRAGQSPDDLYQAAQLALRQGRLSDAQDLADRGIASTRRAPDSLWAWTFRLLRADIHVSENELTEARPDLEASLPADTSFNGLRARQQYLQARVEIADGHLREALDRVERTRTLANQDSDSLDIDNLRGQLRLRLGEWSTGESILTDVVARASAEGDHYHEARALNDLGMGYVVRNRFDESLTWFERILAMHELQAFTLYPRALYNAGIGYRRVGQFDKAVSVQRQAVDAYEKVGTIRDREQALGQLGSTLFLQGSPQAGTKYLIEAFDTATASGLADDAAIWAGNLASASLELEDWDTARRYNEEARRIKQARQSTDLTHNTLIDAVIAAGRGDARNAERLFKDILAADAPPDVVWESQAGLARLALASGRHDQANEYFQAALGTIEHTRSGLLKSDYRLSFLSRLIRFYQAYVDELVDQHQVGRALEVADSSRARVLAERDGSTATPRASASRFRELAARSGTVLLSYWLAPAQSYLWIVSGQGIDLRALPPASEIDTLVRTYQAMIASSLADPLAGTNTAGDELYRALVAPAARVLRPGARVVIVPDGILYGLNFETLPVNGPERHYWIEDAQVEIAPSLATLTVNSRRSMTREPSLLAVGDPVPHPPDFPALTYAAAEMSAVTRPFDAERLARLEGGDASPEAYEDANPGRFTFVHFAAHATANVESPLDSAIILSGDDSRYKLYARDVAGETLHAELVTVSACRSAGERAYAGEGLIGFAWAFLRAGAKRVVAGLWDVDDRSTAALMEQLYAGLTTGLTPGQALRQAKLDLIREGGSQAKPYYWAPFELFTVSLEP